MSAPKEHGTYTIDWYVKWFSSVIVLAAMSVRGIPEYSQIDLYLSCIGLMGWLVVSLLWKDRALILINSVGLVFILRTIIQQNL
jgi:hypothetical protein